MRSSTVSAMQEFHCDCVFFKLGATGFKKYHLLFPNYTSAFISSLNCLYQRDQDGHTSSRNFPEQVALKLAKLYKKLGNCSNITADSVAPTESINFISLGGDSLTDEGYNLRQVTLFTFSTQFSLKRFSVTLNRCQGVF